MWYSCPSRFRRISVLLIVATALAMGVVLKLVRDFGILPSLSLLDAKGTSPNFVLPFCSVGILVRNRRVTLRHFVGTAFGAAVGMTAYEIMQVWMPWRTFDYWDILASIIGAMVSVLFAWVVYFRPEKRNGQIDTEHAPAADAASPGAPSSHPSTQRS